MGKPKLNILTYNNSIYVKILFRFLSNAWIGLDFKFVSWNIKNQVYLDLEACEEASNVSYLLNGDIADRQSRRTITLVGRRSVGSLRPLQPLDSLEHQTQGCTSRCKVKLAPHFLARKSFSTSSLPIFRRCRLKGLVLWCSKLRRLSSMFIFRPRDRHVG